MLQQGLCLLLSIIVLAAAIDVTTALAAPKVAVVGGTGRLGQIAVEKLLRRRIPVKCLIRQEDPPEALLAKQKVYGGNLEFVTGDVTSQETLNELLSSCTACMALHGATRRTKLSDFWNRTVEDEDMSHAKQVNFVAMSKIVNAAKASGTCKHILRVTGKGEDPFGIFSILINGLGSFAKGWNYEGEQVLRNATSIDYTIVRPGIMKGEAPENTTLTVVDNGQDLPVSAVSYTDIAELFVLAFLEPRARRTTLTAMNTAIDESVSKQAVHVQLQNFKPDTRLFPATLIATHKRAVTMAFSIFSLVALSITAKIFTVLLSLLK